MHDSPAYTLRKNIFQKFENVLQNNRIKEKYTYE